MRQFNVLIGLPLDMKLVLAGTPDYTFPEINMPGNIATFIDNRPDVQLAALALAQAKSQQLGANINRYAPSVSLSETASISDLIDSPGLPKTGTFTLSVSIPLNGYIYGSKESMTIYTNRSAVEQAEINLSQTKLAARDEIEAIIDTLEQLKENIEIKKLNEIIAGRAYELSVQAHEAGLITQTALDDALAKHLSAQLSVLSTANNYRTSIIDFAHALNISERDLYK
ncbi:TolC family protein [Brucepastera parasyntrophica]|uniref:TolC family protein n=1 Tax=Brucepastera parasyntrophica TaxID=2880008 RepID=UPI0034E1FA28